MTTRRKAFLLCLLVVCAGALAWKFCREREPVYQGKSLGAWLDFVRQNDGLTPTGVCSPSAQMAVRAMRERAIPVLLRMLTVNDSALRNRLVDLSLKEEWLQIHFRPRQEQQEMAICGFALLGPTAKPAVPALIRLLHDDDPQTRGLAAYCLGRIGPEASDAVASLTDLLSRQVRARTNSEWDEKSIFLTVYALGEMGPAAHDCVSWFNTLRSDSNWMVQCTANAGLMKITGFGMDQVLDSLQDSSNPTNWSKACQVVAFLGSTASNAVPFLLQAMENSGWHVQEKALEALGNIRAQPELCIPTILRCLESTNEWVRFHSMSALKAYGTNVVGRVPTSRILAGLSDSSELVRVNAASLLRQVAPEAALKAGVPLGP